MFRALERGMCWSVGSPFFPLSGLPFPLEAHLSGAPTGAFRAERRRYERARLWVAWTTDVLKLASSTYEKSRGGAGCGERHMLAVWLWACRIFHQDPGWILQRNVEITSKCNERTRIFGVS